MTTTDSNGLIQYQTTDNVVPLQTTLNAISSSVSTSLNSTVRTFKVANDTERNALATTRVPSATNPLVVFNSASGKGYHEINTGSGWSPLISPITNSRMATPSTYAWKDSTAPLLVKTGSLVHCTSGGLYKASGNYTFSNTWASFGAIIPAGFAPKSRVTHPAEVIQNDSPYIASLEISTDGSLRARTAINININEGNASQALIIPSMTWEAA